MLNQVTVLYMLSESACERQIAGLVLHSFAWFYLVLPSSTLLSAVVSWHAGHALPGSYTNFSCQVKFLKSCWMIGEEQIDCARPQVQPCRAASTVRPPYPSSLSENMNTNKDKLKAAKECFACLVLSSRLIVLKLTSDRKRGGRCL